MQVTECASSKPDCGVYSVEEGCLWLEESPRGLRERPHGYAGCLHSLHLSLSEIDGPTLHNHGGVGRVCKLLVVPLLLLNMSM